MTKILLSNYSTTPPENINKDDAKKITKKLVKEISSLQKKLYASKNKSILVVLQGMDASGKNGVVNTVFEKISPHGINEVGFKKPTKIEYSHDFLWRIHQNIPSLGQITIFNRSHYEDILVPSVYGYIDEETINNRYNHINNFERLIIDHGTLVLKFYLNVSPEKQKERLQERMELKHKHWKHNDGDWKERGNREIFDSVYEKIFNICNVTPWHIVPADTNWYKAYYVAKEVHNTLTNLNLEWPEIETDMSEIISP